MGDSFAPGQKDFWIFWVLTVPFCVSIVLYIFLSNLRLRDGYIT
jgi:hypothetical protein